MTQEDSVWGDTKMLAWMEEHTRATEVFKLRRVAWELNEAAEEAVLAYQRAADSLTEEDFAYMDFIYSVYRQRGPGL